MSELKDYKVYTTRNEGAWGYHYEPNPNKDSSDIELNGKRVYLKKDADKVIAEKDEKIDELEERIDELQKATDSAWSKVNAMYDELRHSNRKRCLAMAKLAVKDDYTPWNIKWHNIWLALAEEPTWERFLQLIHKEAK